MRNASRPVNRLPPEIISHIAQHIVQPSGDTASVIPLTHVCQYWRKSIISTPANWTSIIYSRPNLTALNLERSKAAPLQLKLRMSCVSRMPGFHNLIMPYIQNVETLLFDELTTIEDLTQTLPNFPQSTPGLRSLELRHWSGKHEWDQSTDPFGSFPSTLRSLSLSNIPLYPSFLGLRNLTELTLYFYTVCPPLDLLGFLGDNRSLQNVNLVILPPAQISQRRIPTMDHLQSLSITSCEVALVRTLISSIPLRGGAHLGITFHDDGTGLGVKDILSGISLTHLSNLSSPTFMEYRSSSVVRLTGPNGSFSYDHESMWSSEVPFTEFSVLSLANIRQLRLTHNDPSVVFHPSSFPALETLIIESNPDISHLFSALFPNSSSFPSLNTLGFLDCDVTDEFMEELTRFASDRKDTTSVRLHCVVIADQDRYFPSADSIRELERHVPVVDVRFEG